MLVSYLSDLAGVGIYGVNVVCAMIFTTGLLIFCRTLPYPELAIAAATPYLIIVVAMGYTRQSAALGFEMLGFVALGRKSMVWFVIWAMLGGTFHRSAVVLVPLVGLMNARNRIWAAALGRRRLCRRLFRASGIRQGGKLVAGYVGTGMSSSGAWIRVLMNVVPALLLLVWRRRFTLRSGRREGVVLDGDHFALSRGRPGGDALEHRHRPHRPFMFFPFKCSSSPISLSCCANGLGARSRSF